ncbi:MAG: chaperone modulator CbpM [Deltaproteobacteria bacterium]|jgi:MerR family transcriptional regulator, heat shock protein HspR
MGKEFWTVNEVIERFEVEETFLRDLEDEEIVCPTCTDDPGSKRFSAGELEKLRLAKLLVEEMEVNLSGVDIILRMRQHMLEMRRQFDAILEDLAAQLRTLEN